MKKSLHFVLCPAKAEVVPERQLMARLLRVDCFACSFPTLSLPSVGSAAIGPIASGGPKFNWKQQNVPLLPVWVPMVRWNCQSALCRPQWSHPHDDSTEFPCLPPLQSLLAAVVPWVAFWWMAPQFVPSLQAKLPVGAVREAVGRKWLEGQQAMVAELLMEGAMLNQN